MQGECGEIGTLTRASIDVKDRNQINETLNEIEEEGDYGWNQGKWHRVDSMKETMAGKKKIGDKTPIEKHSDRRTEETRCGFEGLLMKKTTIR